MIDLTNDYDPGSKDPGKTYTHAMVVNARFDRRNNFIRLEWQYGQLLDGSFVPGLEPPKPVNITGDDYDDLDAYVSQADEGCLDACDRAFHQYLIDKSHTAGTIVGS